MVYMEATDQGAPAMINATAIPFQPDYGYEDNAAYRNGWDDGQLEVWDMTDARIEDELLASIDERREALRSGMEHDDPDNAYMLGYTHGIAAVLEDRIGY